MTNQPSKPPVFFAIGIGVALVGAGAAMFLAMAPAPAPEPVARVAPVQVQAPPATGPNPSDQAEPHLHDGASEPSAAAAEAAHPKPNRMARDLERERIWAALGRKHSLKPAAPGSAAPTESAATLLPSLDREYIRGSIREQLVPVAVDCYETVLAEQPELGGTIVFEFTIIGDEEVGGVVEAVELGDESTLDNEFLRECLSESLLAVTFPPPPDGGRVEVSYPMTFEPD